jgi:hypothetical protein
MPAPAGAQDGTTGENCMERITLSQAADFKDRLEAEAELVWVARPEDVMGLKWVREYDARKYLVKAVRTELNRFNVVAYTVDGDGRMVRVFRDRKEDVKNYDGLCYGPMEAVRPDTIACGKPTVRPD